MVELVSVSDRTVFSIYYFNHQNPVSGRPAKFTYEAGDGESVCFNNQLIHFTNKIWLNVNQAE